jgi:hypothetical protein
MTGTYLHITDIIESFNSFNLCDDIPYHFKLITESQYHS